MKKSLILGVALAAIFSAGEAQAFDTFIPLGFGYSTSNAQPSQLSAAERRAISQADIYETDIYQRQLHARQFDSKLNHFLNDRNSDGTENFLDY